MRRFLALGVFFAATTALHASIIYNAFISCPSCVTVSVSWFNEPAPVFFVEVDDSLTLNPLFVLNVFTPATTGSITPNPQTVSGLPPSTINAITRAVVVTSLEDPGSQSSIQQAPGEPILALWGEHHTSIVDSVPFVAAPAETVPEPAAWSLAAAGFGLLMAGARILKRKSRH